MDDHYGSLVLVLGIARIEQITYLSEKVFNGHWARVLPIKDTLRAHIVQAMSSCISDEDLKMVKSVFKQKSIGHNDNDDDEQEPKKKNAREILNLSRWLTIKFLASLDREKLLILPFNTSMCHVASTINFQ